MERATRYGSYIPVTTIGIAPILIRDQWATHPPIYLQAYHNRIPGAIGSTEARDTSYGLRTAVHRSHCGGAAHQLAEKRARKLGADRGAVPRGLGARPVPRP